MNKITLVTSLLLMTFSSAQAVDIKDGKIKHDAKCTACHVSQFGKDGSGIYTRKNRKMTSYSMLTQRVKACNVNTKSGFSDGDVTNVIEYLNSAYYKFTK